MYRPDGPSCVTGRGFGAAACWAEATGAATAATIAEQMRAMARRMGQAYCNRSALRRWTVTCGGAFTATAVDAAQSSSPVDGPVPRRARSTSVRGANVAASPTSGAVRAAKTIARRSQLLAPGTRAGATSNEKVRLRTRWALG